MRSLLFVFVAALVAVTGVANAQEKSEAMTITARAVTLGSGRLSTGGAAERLLWRDDSGFSAGVTTLRGASALRSWSADSRTPMAGFLAWTDGDYRLDANFRPLGISGFSAGIGAQAGVPSGAAGTSYGVRINAGLAGERFSLNQANRLGVIDLDAAGSDLNLMATINHAFTPSFSVAGTAEARRSMNGPVEALPQRELLIGAGLGLKF